MIRTAELESVTQEVMKSTFYEVVKEDLDTVQQNFRRQYFKLAKLVEVADKSDRVGHMVRRSMNCSDAWYSDGTRESSWLL